MRFQRLEPAVMVYAPDGRFTPTIPVSLPGADLAWAEDVAVDADDSFAIAAAGAVTGSMRVSRHAIVLDDANGLQTVLIDTKNFVPGRVAFGGDRSVWVLGAQYKYEQSYAGDYTIVRKYSRSGELLGSYLPRSTFPEGLEPGMAGIPAAIFAAGNRVVVVAISGKNSGSLELIELDNDGRALGRMPLPHYGGTGFTLTADGHFYSLLPRRKNGIDKAAAVIMDELDLIDILTQAVKNIELPSPVGYLMGADGNNLVFRVRGEAGKTTAGWFSQPALR